MATTVVNVPVPQEVYERLERAAARLEKAPAAVLAETLQAVFPIEREIPAAIRREIEQLAMLDTVSLRQVAEEEMADDTQAAFEQLLDLQDMRPLTEDEATSLEALRNEYGRILVRKARAYALLAERGQPIAIEQA